MSQRELALQTGLLGQDNEAVNRILAAAERCFCGAGYSASTMREIAEEADVSKSLLHYHFRSKEHLFLEVLARIYQRLATTVRQAVAERGTLADRSIYGVDALFAALGNSPDFQVQVKIWAHSLSDERLRQHARQMREHLRGVLIDTMIEILGPAKARLPVDLAATADLLWAVVVGLGLQSACDDDPERVETAFNGLRQVLTLALGALESAGPSG
jgi:AcrR family transcriptional regulator